MSFKREGDDRSQLNLLKKRRVAELLANDIPDDEALLMRNGRYACTVCSHRPVFDTVDMLAIHRQGKKHKKGQENHYARKRNFALEVQKRKQEIALRTQDTSKVTTVQVEAPLLQKTRTTVRNALLKAAPYDSRSKVHQSSSGDQTARNDSNEKKGLFFQTTRKHRLQLSQVSSSQSTLLDVTETTPASSLPGNTNSSSSMSHPSQAEDKLLDSEERTSHKFEKKSLFMNDDEQKPKFQLQPYIPKSKRKPHSSPTQNFSKLTPRGPVLPTVPLQDYKPRSAFWEPLHRDGIPQASATPKEVSSRQQESLSQSALHHSHNINKQNTHVGTNLQQANSAKEQNSTVNPDSSVRSNVMKELLQRDAKKNTALDQVQQALIGKKTERPQTDKADATPVMTHSCSPPDATRMSDKRRKELQHHLHLTSSGWKQDHSGNWIKDEEVEFDSDEETPPFF